MNEKKNSSFYEEEFPSLSEVKSPNAKNYASQSNSGLYSVRLKTSTQAVKLKDLNNSDNIKSFSNSSSSLASVPQIEKKSFEHSKRKSFSKETTVNIKTKFSEGSSAVKHQNEKKEEIKPEQEWTVVHKKISPGTNDLKGFKTKSKKLPIELQTPTLRNQNTNKISRIKDNSFKFVCQNNSNNYSSTRCTNNYKEKNFKSKESKEIVNYTRTDDNQRGLHLIKNKHDSENQYKSFIKDSSNCLEKRSYQKNGNANILQSLSTYRETHPERKHVSAGESKSLNKKLNVSSSSEATDKVNVADLNPIKSSKKKRKSKIKRQAAFQSDKLKIITPEIHSKILNLNNKAPIHSRTYEAIDINDSNEYPELGMNIPQKSKTDKKESFDKQTSSKDRENLDISVKISSHSKIADCSITESNESVHYNEPITISLSDMLLKSKKREQEKGADITIVKTAPKSISKKQASSFAVNPLDSSKPAVKRGKERENPKPKKPSQLKKIILQDRMLKKEQILKRLSTANIESNVFKDNFLNESEKENLKEKCSNLNPFQTELQINSLEVDDTVKENLENCDINSITMNADEKLNSTDLINLDKCNNNELNNKCIPSESQPLDINYNSDDETHSSKFNKEYPDIDTFCSNENSSKFTESKQICTELSSPHLTQDEEIFVEKQSAIIESNLENINRTNNRSIFIEEILSPELRTSFQKSIDSNSSVSFSLQEVLGACLIVLHSKKFREYCTHFLSKELEESVIALLNDLVRFQDRMHQKDPVKARVKKRLLYGIREIKRHMALKKLKCIIIASDVEDSKTEGGLNDLIRDLISLARNNHIPCVFSLLRRKLGQICHKPAPVSAVGILNYEGSEVNFKAMLKLQTESQIDYLKVLRFLSSKLTNEQINLLYDVKDMSDLHNITRSVLREYFPRTENVDVKTNNTLKIPDSSDIHSSNVDSCLNEELAKIKQSLSTNPIGDTNSEEVTVYNILLKYKIVNY